MKNELKNVISILLSCLMLLTASCKKDGSGPNAKGCLITSAFQEGRGYLDFQYDKKGNMISYELASLIRTWSWGIVDNFSGHSTKTFTQYLSYNDQDTVRYTTHYRFDNLGNVKDLPSSATESISRIREGLTISDKENIEYAFTWDSERNLIATESKPLISNYGGVKTTITYNPDGNVATLIKEYTSGEHSGKTETAIISGYDTNPTPYNAIPYWKFVHPSRLFSFRDFDELVGALSKNNPIIIKVNDFLTRTMRYAYNEKGYPLKRKNVFFQDNSTASSFVPSYDTFTYDCK